MAAFAYEALGRDGTKVQGRVEALDARTAAELLKQRSLFILSLDDGRPAATTRQRTRTSRSIPAQQLVFFFRELALMVRSGVTLMQALELCARRVPNRALADTIEAMIEEIQGGRSLSQAMRSRGRTFSRIATRLVESAEASGELDPVLERIADLTERRSSLKRSLITSLSYPAIVVFAALGVGTFLVVGVVPKFAAFFGRRGVPLPWTTQALLDLSAWMRSYGIWLLAGVVVVLGTIAYLWFTGRGRVWIDRNLLRIPVIGGLLSVAAFSQICWTLGALLRSGVNLLESLRITASVASNRAVGEHVGRGSDRILAGGNLAAALEDPMVPAVVTSLLAAGERAGSLTDVLSELSQYYQRELQARVGRLSRLVEPALIIVVGAMVAFVYLAFFQALMQLTA